LKKIETLIIDNFQSHKHTEINFSDFVAIVGESNSGKTAIVRALKWVLYNVPSGTSFMRVDTNETKVKVIFSDGSAITRLRSETKNNYVLEKSNGEEIVLEHFGVGPVQDVVAFHKMYELDLFGTKESVNFCNQLDPPFFISQPDGVKAMMIGKLAGTQTIDLAIKNTSADARAEAKVEKQLKQQASLIKAELSRYKKLSKNKKILDKCQVKIEKTSELHDKYENAKLIAEQIYSTNQEILGLKGVLDKKNDVEKLSNIFSFLENDIRKYIDVTSQMMLINETDNNIAKVNEILNSVKQEDINIVSEKIKEIDYILLKLNSVYPEISNIVRTEASLDEINKILSAIHPGDYDKIYEAMGSAEDNAKVLTSIKSILIDIDTTMQRIEKAKEYFKKSEEEFAEIKNEYTSILKENRICPTCMTEISDETVHKIADALR